MYLNSFKHLPIVIAEAGVNHNGDIRLAEKLIEAAASAKADFIKFQTFKAGECASHFAPTANYQENDTTTDQFSLLSGLELPFPAFAHLKKFAEQLGIGFISTPDGILSLELLVELQVCAIKIASGELTNLPFLQLIGQTRKPVILSTGMGTIGEVQIAIDTLMQAGAPEISLLHCTTEYPAPPQETNLRVISTLQQAFNLPVGFSDHTEGSEAAIAATALGAVIIEKHLTLDRHLPGPDHAASMEPDQFAGFVESIRKTTQMLGSGIKRPTPTELPNRPLVRRALVAACNLRAGDILTRSQVAIKRPATGIAPDLLLHALNRRLVADLAADEPILWQHLGEVVKLES